MPLSPENGEAVTLTMMLIGEQARGLAPMYFDAISEGDGAEDRLRFLERVLSTLGSPLVVEAQRISMDRASKKAAASKGRK